VSIRAAPRSNLGKKRKKVRRNGLMKSHLKHILEDKCIVWELMRSGPMFT